MRFLILATTLVLSATATEAQTPSDRSPQVLTGRDRSYITLYAQPGLSGSRYIVTMRTSNFGTLPRVESLRVTGGRWEVCERLGFRGECRIAEGRYLTLSDLGLRRIGSLRPVESQPQG